MNDFQLAIILNNHRELWTGAMITIKITAVSFVIALAIGMVVGLARSRPGFLRWIFTPYVEVFRGTPLLIQLFFIYYAPAGHRHHHGQFHGGLMWASACAAGRIFPKLSGGPCTAWKRGREKRPCL